MDSDRRKLCQAGAGGLLVLGAASLPGCGSGGDGGNCGAAAFATQYAPDDVPEGQAVAMFTGPGMKGFFICHDSKGFYAMDGNCTHVGCFVNFVEANMGFHCDCHGATYDFNGGSPTTPAVTPMPHYALCVSDGVFQVDTAQMVDATKRYRF
jgi:Rieske Fe-S protein